MSTDDVGLLGLVSGEEDEDEDDDDDSEELPESHDTGSVRAGDRPTGNGSDCLSSGIVGVGTWVVTRYWLLGRTPMHIFRSWLICSVHITSLALPLETGLCIG